MKAVAVIGGDGIGPEVISSAVRAVAATRAEIEMVPATMGLRCFRERGSYLPQETLDTLEGSDACLFGAITSPPDDPCYNSPLLFLRRHFDLFANVRPAKRVHPSVGLSDVDLVIVRENTEGMYTGVEKESAGEVITERKVTERACKRIVDYAISLSKKEKRHKLTCVHKANVLRKSDGLFRNVFLSRIACSGLDWEEMYVDATAAAMVSSPSRFDCIVTLNLYGDILSDEAAAIAGGLGLAPSGNIGERFAIFEPVHGSAPDIAGKGIANPIAAILSASMMLEHLGFKKEANLLEKAVSCTLAEGYRTRDIGGNLSTERFTERYVGILERIGDGEHP